MAPYNLNFTLVLTGWNQDAFDINTTQSIIIMSIIFHCIIILIFNHWEQLPIKSTTANGNNNARVSVLLLVMLHIEWKHRLYINYLYVEISTLGSDPPYGRKCGKFSIFFSKKKLKKTWFKKCLKCILNTIVENDPVWTPLPQVWNFLI